MTLPEPAGDGETQYVETADGEIPNTTTADTTTAGDELPMGDVDPGATRSADETGQGGDPTEPAKNKAHPWNG
jgi:hypothetical protein